MYVSLVKEPGLMPASKPEIMRGKNYRVLIVDDSKESADTLGWSMELLGHTPYITHTGQEALHQAEKIRPHVVLLDISLPDIDGYEVFRALKKNPFLKNTLFVAQTGLALEEHRRCSLGMGFDHHLTKPFKLEDLEKILESSLQCLNSGEVKFFPLREK